MAFAGPLFVTGRKKRILLVFVKHLSGWPTLKVTKRAKGEIVRLFMEKIVIPLDETRVVISDKGSCFTSRLLVAFIESYETEWCTVSAYALMSNGRADMMVALVGWAAARMEIVS